MTQDCSGPAGFAVSLARSLTRSGNACTLIWVSEKTLAETQSTLLGVDVLYLKPLPVERWWPDFPFLLLGDQIAPVLSKFDLVYSFLWGHPAMHAIRQRRYSPSRLPFFVTIANDTLETAADRCGRSPTELKDWNQGFGERYQARYSDWLICMEPIDSEQLRARGWALPAAECARSMGSNMADWLRLHEHIKGKVRAASASPKSMPPAKTEPAVTVCMPYFNHGRYLAATLKSLAQQTSRDFTVIVVDDGSTSVESQRVFDDMHNCYRERGWRFLRQPNASASAARNLAVRRAESDYVLLWDADDIAPPRLVERMLEAIRYSGDDVLTVWHYKFAHDQTGYDFQKDELVSPASSLYTPPGDDRVGNLVQHFYGTLHCIARRSVFQAVGGFPEALRAADDIPPHIRIALSGHSSDVIPEFLCYHRDTPDGISKWMPRFQKREVAWQVYDEWINPLRLPSLAQTFLALHERKRAAERRMTALCPTIEKRFSRTKRTGRLRLLILTPWWPYPPRTGTFAHTWAKIRFLGTRHDLTLVGFGAQEAERHRRIVLRYCRFAFAVRRRSDSPPDSQRLPQSVRQYQTIEMQQLLESIPTRNYDAAVIEYVFLAPYLKFIHAPTILAEHGVISASLAQAAERPLFGCPTGYFESSPREAELLREFEDSVWPEFPVRTVVSEEERIEIQRRAKTGRTILVENGSDPTIRLRHPSADTGTVLFLGTLSYYPNIDSVLYLWREIWPHLIRLDHSLRLIVAGKSPVPEIRALAGQPGLELIDSPPDIRPIAARASVTVAPLRVGSGVRLKILDSMALGLPVVSSTIGCAGLDVEDGKHLLIRDEPIAFAEAIHRLLNDRPLWQTLHRNGRQLIEQRYSWDRVFEPLDTVLHEIAHTK
jgi:glycosyltransferase involved in cell wall biosynthesis